MGGQEPDDLLQPIEQPQTLSDLSRKEQKLFQQGEHERYPNSLYFKLGGFGFISWHSESGTAVLALLILTCLSVVALVTIFALMFVTEKGWATEFLKIVGQGMLAVSGAVIGAGASAASIRRRKR